jgi:hypothetical protein
MNQDSSIDQTKLNKFLEGLNEKDKGIVNKIVENTIYMSREELFSSLHRCVDRLNTIAPEYNLYIPKGCIGSEHWIVSVLEDILKPVMILWGHDEHTTIDNDYPIVVLDDAIYSSVNMCGTLDQLRYDTGITNKAYCVVAVASSLDTQISDFNGEIITDRVLDHLQARNLFEEYDYDYMYETFKCETECVLPLYFDHKVANEFGSYQFYHKIVKDPISRAPVDAITEDNLVKIVERLREKRKTSI